MNSLSVHFTGYNGFGQFKNLQKIVTEFQETSVEYNAYKSVDHKSIKIQCTWNYLVFSIDNVLNVCGYVCSEFGQMRSIPFECSIRDVSCGEKFCLILLKSGIVYKLNVRTLETTEINPIIFTQREQAIVERKSIFGAVMVGQDISMNKHDDEIITHIASGRTLSVAVSNLNAIYNIPLKIYTFPSHVKIKKICCGNEHCLILSANGDVYAFGSSSRGQLGLGTLDTEEQPVLIDALAGIKIIDIAAGGWHSAAISAFNDLYVWGWNVNGQLGLSLYKEIETIVHGDQIKKEIQKKATVFTSPILLDLPMCSDEDGDEGNALLESQYHPVEVFAGTRHTIVRTADGSVLGSGWNKYRQLGSDHNKDEQDKFVRLKGIDSSVNDDYRIVCGEWSTMYFSIK